MNEKKRLSSKTWVKRLLSFVLALAMMVTMIPSSSLQVAKAEETKTIYLNAGGSGLWDQAGAWFAAWVWGSAQADAWYTFADSDFDGVYEIEIPADASGMKILRKDPASSELNWEKWNETGDLTIPADKNCYTITGWGASDGNWSNYTPVAPVFTVAGSEGLCGTAWDVSNTSNDMTKNTETGLYEKVYTDVAAETYEYKVVLNHSWDKSWGNGSGNASVAVEDDGSTVTVTFDPISGTVSAAVVKNYTVTFQGNNVTSDGAAVATKGVDYTAKLTAADGYALPETIGLTVGGIAVDTDIMYEETSGDFVIPGANVIGDIVITAAGVKTTRTIYLNAGGSGLWDQAGAWFAAWVWGSVQADAWYTFADSDFDGVYEIEIPADASGMKVLRKDPASSELNWEKWNETGELTIPADKNCYTITGWGASDGNWSNYTPVAPVFTVAGSEGLCGTDWNTSDTGNDMVLNTETGLYEKVYTNVAAETYEYKVVLNHSWDKSWGNGGSNASVTVEESGSTVTITFDPISSTVAAVVEAPVVEEPSTITVYFRNDWLWPEVFVHYWNDNNAEINTEWPGMKMTKVDTVSTDYGDRDVYSAEIPAQLSGIIFNGLENGNASNRQQTSNIESGIEDGNAYYIYWDNGNKAGTFEYTPSGSGDDEEPPAEPSEIYEATFHFADTLGWGTVNLYTWYGAGTQLTGGWPGTSVSKDADGFYTMTVTFEDPNKTGLNFIFNNGGAQTVDLNLPHSAFDEDRKAEKWIVLTDMTDGKYNANILDNGDSIAISPQVNGTSVTFEYKNASAASVEVRGTFNSWASGANVMTKDAHGIWSVTIEDLEPGLHEYKFVVDGSWITDPCNSQTQNGNSTFLILDPSAMDHNEITINVYYNRSDGLYTVEDADGAGVDGVWNAYVWGDSMGGTRYDFTKNGEGKMVTTIKVVGRKTQCVNLKTRLSTDTKDWLKEESQVSISLTDIVSGTVDVYITSNGTSGNAGSLSVSQILNVDIVKGNKISDLQYDYDTGKITVSTLNPLTDPASELEIVNVNDTNDDVAIESIANKSGSYELTVNQELALNELYNYEIKFEGYYYDIGIDSVYASDKFAEGFTYDGDDLGVTYANNESIFKVWAPTATEVNVLLYATGSDSENGAADLGRSSMTKGEKGVWSVAISGDLKGVYYTYEVTVNGETIEAADPYGRSNGVNGKRSMVVDLDDTDPNGWDQDGNPNPLTSYTDAVIYELHVRDFSIDESSGVSEENRGKFMAFTEEGTTVNGEGEIVSGVDYLENLGITHLHLLPIYDYASVKEDKLDTPQFNWGYDPLNYNVPEGSYSTNPYDGNVRVNEMKQMVMALHDNGISVIMDVVYNHVYNADTFCFNQIVPGYFSRVDSNASGCGNDTASEREMVRKYIVESVLYWTEEYHIDGFRFDLVGLLDVETINEIVTEVHKIRPDVIFYGEGWDMDGTNKEPGTEMAKQGNSSKTPGFAYFSDNIRNLLGGNNGHSIGFVSGQSGVEGDVVNNFMAKPWWTSNPTQVVQYASCHDNYTLIDKIVLSTGKAKMDASVIKMNNLAAAVYMTAQGIPFIHAGEEFLREKLDENGKRVENSYNASDFVNHLEWSNLENKTYAENSQYYKGLIAFRKAHPALSLATSEEVAAVVYNQQASGNVVSFWIDGRQVDGETHDSIYVIFNANSSARTIELPEGDWDICINGTQAGTDVIDTVSGNVSVAGISAMVLVQEESTEEPVGPAPESDVALPGSFNGWNTGNFMGIGEEENTVVTTLSLPAGEYTFKVKIGDTWYGNNGTIEDETGADGWLMDASAGDCKLQASGGAYTFIYNTVTKKLVVVYDAESGEFGDPGDYYLCGWINGMDYAMGIEPGEYKFENGKLIAKFDQDSYVLVKNGDNTKTYWTDGYLGGVTSATLYDQTKHSLTQDKWDKMLIPGGVEVEFTLTVNDNDTVTLSYVSTASMGVKDTSGVQDGVTLHCWNWSFEEIEKNMEAIAAQGFTAIQTSPIQPLKEATNLEANSVGGNWWVYYQPIDFVIMDQSGNALGTKEELKSMIETAHEYGIQVIVDVVANHLANETGNDLADEIPEEIRGNAEYWHDITTNITNWNDRFDMTQHCMGGLPDLNTGNAEVQSMVLDFLKECVDLGVDGFRFDAAKSIETPSDNVSFASDFWPIVVGGAEGYAQENYGKDLYIYGEVLDVPAISVSAYTQYMAITDNSWGNNLRNDVVNGNANLSAGYHKAANADNLVLWAESHDTYMTGDEAQSSYGVSEANINKTWALVAARADAMGLYFARPESIEQALGVASVTGWDNEEVQVVNWFHNFFAGKGEFVSNEETISYVERGGERTRSTEAAYGVVLVNMDGGAAQINVTAHLMADGTYVDQITGNEFIVAEGKITGEIGESGIAVVYNPVKYKVVVDGASIGQFVPGAEVKIQGGFRNGYSFVCWNSENVKVFADENARTTTFIMPAEDVEIASVWKQVYQPSQPQQPSQGNNAPTGDNSSILLYSMVALAALAVMAEAERRRRRA